jgi:hypothetical protein
VLVEIREIALIVISLLSSEISPRARIYTGMSRLGKASSSSRATDRIGGVTSRTDGISQLRIRVSVGRPAGGRSELRTISSSCSTIREL